MSDNYLRFRIENKQESDWFKTTLKILVILFLITLIVLVGVWGFKALTKPDIKQHPIIQKQIEQPPKQIIIKQQNTLSKQEIAIIIKSVIQELLKEQQKMQSKIANNNSQDSKLYRSLQQNIKEENFKTPNIKNQEAKMKKLATKKIKRAAKPKKDQIIKKEIVYNAVIINHKVAKDINDLAKLYASINKIAKNKKKKILQSAYAKKIKKEIIIRKNEMRTIVVQPGDTLSSIAQRAYGKASMYKKIFEANPDLLSNPNKLKVGMRLRVPK